MASRKLRGRREYSSTTTSNRSRRGKDLSRKSSASDFLITNTQSCVDAIAHTYSNFMICTRIGMGRWW
jgi:hypothetical protein